jgi:hypothetical protein
LTIPVLVLASIGTSLLSCTTVRRDLALRPTRDSVAGYGLPNLPVSTFVMWGPLLPFVPHWTSARTVRFSLSPPSLPYAFTLESPAPDTAAPSSNRCPPIAEAELLPNFAEYNVGCRYRAALPLDTLHVSLDSLRATIPYRSVSTWSWSILPLPWPVAKAWAEAMNPWPD